MNQKLITGIIYATVLAWTAMLFIEGQSITSAFLKPLSMVTSVVLSLAIGFDLWFWKWLIFRHWLVKRPVLEGTWKVEIASDWTDPNSGHPIAPVNGYMVVRQTLSTLSMRQLTSESNSVLVGTELVCALDGLYCISGVYRNEPNLEFRKQSPIHYGALWLNIAEDEGKLELSGHYWTDRSTKGSIKMSCRMAAKYQTFEAARVAATKA